jgi:hypothetical protein
MQLQRDKYHLAITSVDFMRSGAWARAFQKPISAASSEYFQIELCQSSPSLSAVQDRPRSAGEIGIF